MHSRKRQASTSLQAPHHIKQPRLQLSRLDGTTSGPTDISLSKRWKDASVAFVSLTWDTCVYALTMPFRLASSTEPDSPVEEYPSPSSSPSPTPKPRPLHHISANSSISPSRRIRSKDPPQKLTKEDGHSSEEVSRKLENLSLTLPPSSSPPNSSSVQSSQEAIATSSTEPPVSSQPVSQQSSITHFSFASTGSSHTSASSPTTQQQVNSFSGSPGKRKRSATPRKEPSVRSKHIHHKNHKQAVKAQKQVIRDQILKQIHALKAKQGYTSSAKDLKGLLNYERLLRNITLDQRFGRIYQKHDNLRIPLVTPETQRILQEDENEFLHRALERAKSTLDSPRPLKPYTPAIEELEFRRKKKDQDLESRLYLPSVPSFLPEEDEQKVKELLRKRGVISKFAREQVSDSDIRRLGPGQWLNDELINFYGALILDRAEGLSKESKAKGGKGLDVHYFSTFFWSKLVNEGYEKGRLAKWTKKIDIFSKDLILIPVNHNNTHWTAAAINFRQKRLESYDSMAYLDQGVFKVLHEYLEAESLNKKKKPFNWDGWTNWAPKTTPQQENGFDCGVFTCQILRAVSRGDQLFAFSQVDMPYLRRRMIWEIGHAKLRDGYS